MKVCELIEALQALDPEAEAYRIYDSGVAGGAEAARDGGTCRRRARSLTFERSFWSRAS